MSKRMYEQSNGATDAEGSRTKRRKEVTSSSDVDVSFSDPVMSGVDGNGQGGDASGESVKEQGFKLWQTIKDAVNKEGRILSLDFLRKPAKRQYPDYYRIIQQPIALDDIKKKLDNGSYASLEAVRSDFELCFNNAKTYNMQDSEIWKDARELLKLANKTYNKLAPPDEEGDNIDGDTEKKGKLKSASLNRLIKSRLQKLVDKTDDSGRVLSTEFMELPSKKDWPIYYKDIKRPQCLENIFKHIKRKEYYTSGEFSADVELVFSNAMSFNQEHTGIWEDAKTLLDYFRLLMSDLPAPYSLPEYSKPSNGKIKIKMPPAQSHGISPSGLPVQASTSIPANPSSLLLRVPGSNPANNARVVSQAPVASPLNIVSPQVPAPTPPLDTSNTLPVAQYQSSSNTPKTSTQSLSYINATFSHYPNASYQPPVASTAQAGPSSLATSPIYTHSTSISPTPPSIHPSHQLKTISLRIQPHNRSFDLDYRDGVKTWSMRLGPGETEVYVQNVTFLGDEEEESSDEEEPELEEKEVEPTVDLPVKSGKKKAKGKAKGRTKGATKAAATKAKLAKAAKKKTQKVGDVQLKMNGSMLKEQEEQGGRWAVSIPVGSSILEVGEVGGLIWKIYIERVSDA